MTEEGLFQRIEKLGHINECEVAWIRRSEAKIELRKTIAGFKKEQEQAKEEDKAIVDKLRNVDRFRKLLGIIEAYGNVLKALDSKEPPTGHHGLYSKTLRHHNATPTCKCKLCEAEARESKKE